MRPPRYLPPIDPICVFWDVEDNNWSINGCKPESHNNNSIICVCDHLTSFGVLMDINGIMGEVKK